VWLLLAGPYHAAVAAPAQFLIGAVESPAVTNLRAQRSAVVVDRSDFPPASPRPGIPASDLDFNIAILSALFASAANPLSDRGILRFLLACFVLYVSHVAALVFGVESLYALDLGEWSRAHYGSFLRNFWATGVHFYRIALIFALPFALWWALAADRPFSEGANESPARAGRSRRRP